MLTSHEIQIRVRYNETDAMGFLHHANHLNYYEMGRTELYRAAGGDYRRLEEQGLFFVVVSLECKYLSPARYDDLLTLKTTLARVSLAKLEHDYELARVDGRAISRAHSVLALVDRQGRVQRIDASILSGLS